MRFAFHLVDVADWRILRTVRAEDVRTASGLLGWQPNRETVVVSDASYQVGLPSIVRRSIVAGPPAQSTLTPAQRAAVNRASAARYKARHPEEPLPPAVARAGREELARLMAAGAKGGRPVGKGRA